MLMTTKEQPDALALLALPSINGFTANQLRGTACVWCAAPLTTDIAVDLGERRHKRLDGHYSTFPRACHGCTREAAVRTLRDHAGTCEQCVDNTDQCDTATMLRLLAKGGAL